MAAASRHAADNPVVLAAAVEQTEAAHLLLPDD